MSNLTNLQTTALRVGRTVTALDVTSLGAGSREVAISVESDTVLVSVYVETTTGDLDVDVYTSAGTEGVPGAELNIISFPTLTAPTTELVLKKAALSMGYIRVVSNYTGACRFVVKVRGIATGEASVRLLGQNEARNYATIVTNSAALLIPSALSDRVGIALHNTDTVKVVYIGFTLGSTTVADGWEVGPGEKIGLDVAAGVEIYATTAAGSSTVKILEAGS